MTKSILFLGYNRNETSLISKLESLGYQVMQTDDTVRNLAKFEMVLSYGYKQILTREQIESTKNPIINLHISYLPFNRGMHPNFWSFYDNTPSGVSIHQIDTGIDTGPLLLREKIEFQPDQQTFSETYSHLKSEIERLFLLNIEQLMKSEIEEIQITEVGTFHGRSQLPEGFRGWDCLISDEISRLKKLSLREYADTEKIPK